MSKRLMVLFLVLALPGLLFAGGGKQGADVAPEPDANGVEQEAEVEVDQPAGTGVPYKAPINIGTKNFTEQFVVGNLMYLLLEDRGYDVELKTGMSSTVLRQAMEDGSLDLCMDYTGTQWLSYTGHEFQGESPEQMYEKTKTSDALRGLIWMNPIWCNNTYAIAVTRDFAEQHDIYNLSAFADYVKAQEGEVPFASDFEFYSRPDGILGLQLHYDFAFQPDYVTTVLPGLTFEYLNEGKSVAAMVFGTDPAVVKFDWVVLEDNKNFWPPYDLAPYARYEVLEANEGLEETLNELVGAFPQNPADARAEMTRLNAMVDVELMEPEEAAEQWLQEQGLID
jgi:osmoprotectant transport system substrate-binding protein